MVAAAGPDAPRVFISHASEDKARFVDQFATKLRSEGVDAWYDRWEMQGGDSLVQRIFECGIAEADAFVVVLSHTSIAKPWVREELDAGVVRRINSDGAVRLIPVVLDDGVDVPMALQHLLWLSVPHLTLDGVVDEIVRVVYGGSTKPQLGPPPAYTSNQSKYLTEDPVDRVVFGLIVEEWQKHGLATVLMSDEIQARASATGVSAGAFAESMEALITQNLIEAKPMASGDRWWLGPIPDRSWLQVEEQNGLDLVAERQRILALIVNDGVRTLRSGELGLHDFTARAIARQLAHDGLVTVHEIVDGTISVSTVSPLARRALRD